MAYQLPDLPYSHDALEPHIDAKTMEIHHGKHHNGYVTKLNAAVEGTEYADAELADLCSKIAKVPENIRRAVRNNGGGHYNHTLFWAVMGPGGGGKPGGELAGAIDDAFGSFESLRDEVTSAAGGQFGSGWGWLTVCPFGTLQVMSTPNQDSPMIKGFTPILGVDVWEHAYYLNYQNRRGDYLDAWWNTVNWDRVAARWNEVKEGWIHTV